jgi:hypothetical protein
VQAKPAVTTKNIKSTTKKTQKPIAPAGNKISPLLKNQLVAQQKSIATTKKPPTIKTSTKPTLVKGKTTKPPIKTTTLKKGSVAPQNKVNSKSSSTKKGVVTKRPISTKKLGTTKKPIITTKKITPKKTTQKITSKPRLLSTSSTTKAPGSSTVSTVSSSSSDATTKQPPIKKPADFAPVQNNSSNASLANLLQNAGDGLEINVETPGTVNVLILPISNKDSMIEVIQKLLLSGINAAATVQMGQPFNEKSTLFVPQNSTKP